MNSLSERYDQFCTFMENNTRGVEVIQGVVAFTAYQPIDAIEIDR